MASPASRMNSAMEAADAPGRFGVGQLRREPIEMVSRVAHAPPADLVKSGGFAPGDPPALNRTPPKMPKPGRRKPAGSSYCTLNRFSMRPNSVQLLVTEY